MHESCRFREVKSYDSIRAGIVSAVGTLLFCRSSHAIGMLYRHTYGKQDSLWLRCMSAYGNNNTTWRNTSKSLREQDEMASIAILVTYPGDFRIGYSLDTPNMICSPSYPYVTLRDVNHVKLNKHIYFTQVTVHFSWDTMYFLNVKKNTLPFHFGMFRR